MDSSSVSRQPQDRDARSQAFGALFLQNGQDVSQWLREDYSQTSTLKQAKLNAAPAIINQIISQPLVAKTTETLPNAMKANWSALSSSGLSDSAFSRLRLLAEQPEDWRGPGSRALSADSIAKFLRFWESVKEIASEPELMLTPMGTIQSEWFRNHRQFLELEFRIQDDSINFGLVDRTQRFEGLVDQQQILNLLRGYREGMALRWGGGN